MEWQWLSSIIKFCKVLGSYIVAVARLVVWTCVFFFSGLQRTLFMKSEVVGVDFKVLPLRCCREEYNDKLSYIDKLYVENPDLIEAEDDGILFDDIMLEELEEDDNLEDDRFEDNGEEDK